MVGPAWVGDMVMSQTLYKALKAQQPDLAIDVLAPAWSEPLLAAMPEVRKAITMPLGHGQFDFLYRRKLGRSLRNEHYRQAFVLPNSWKSALVPWFANIPQRTGWRGESRYGLLNDLRVLNKARYPFMVQRYVALSSASGKAPQQLADIAWPKLEVDQAQQANVAEKLSLDPNTSMLAICPGAEFGPAKRWPESHYAEVAASCIEAGQSVLLFGSVKDQPVAEMIREKLPVAARSKCLNLAGQTSLNEAIYAMSLCDSAVSNDSGLMHIAAALGLPLAAVYGSTSAGFTPPLGAKVSALSIAVDCGPCFERECPLQHMKCLVDLRPGKVLEALGELRKA